MTKHKNQSVLNALVNLDKLPKHGRDLSIIADEEQLLRIAQISKVTSLGRFAVDMLVTGVKGGIEVTGRLTAEITQPCVVTLEPVHQRIDEPLNRVFLSRTIDDQENAPGSEAYVDLGPDDIPDYYEGTEIDLSNYLLETLGLAINLYPRVPGAKMGADQAGDSPADLSPFSVLKTLTNED